MLGETTNPASSEAAQSPIVPIEQFQILLETKYHDVGVLVFPDESRMDKDLVDATMIFLPEKISRDVLLGVADKVNEEIGKDGVKSFIRSSIAEKRIQVAERWRAKYGEESTVPYSHDLLMLIFSDEEVEPRYWDAARQALSDYYLALDEADGDHDTAIKTLR